ncbi:MAG: biotin--[acetyl-CoA-carboxylase] ligase [Rudaea sp.]
MSIQPFALLSALPCDGFVSGSDLARRLGVTRAAVWKQIEALRALGAPVEGAAGSGYRLAWPFEPLDQAAIARELTADLKRRVENLTVAWQIDSTNTALLRDAAAAAPDLSVIVAEIQSDGRGRRGRRWQSPLGGNVYFSLLRRFPSGMASLAGLSIVAGIALVHALHDCGIDRVGLKWPNDVLVDDRKLAGILVELGGEFLGPCFAVIGIGINVRLPNEIDIDQPYVDIASLAGDRPPGRNRLIGRLIQRLAESTDEFVAHGFAAFEQRFAEHDLLAQRRVLVHAAGAVLEGVADGVDARGALRVRHGERVAVYDSAEVSVRRT